MYTNQDGTVGENPLKMCRNNAQKFIPKEILELIKLHINIKTKYKLFVFNKNPT